MVPATVMSTMVTTAMAVSTVMSTVVPAMVSAMVSATSVFASGSAAIGWRLRNPKPQPTDKGIVGAGVANGPREGLIAAEVCLVATDVAVLRFGAPAQ